MYYFKKHITFLVALVITVGCDDVFDYSPYEANVDGKDKNQTANNLKSLKTADTTEADSFSFVTLADSHLDYYELEKAIEKINSLSHIHFVVHLGDMTDHGWLMEYEIFSDYIKKLTVPVLTCIGNHDYLSAGEKIYLRMFGKFNYSLVYQNRKLIFFDATTFESKKQPNMNWLAAQLKENDLPKIVFSHIPPWDDQYSKENTLRFQHIIHGSNTILSMYGHHHAFHTGALLETNTDFIIPGSVNNRKLCKVTVFADNTYKMSMIPF